MEDYGFIRWARLTVYRDKLVKPRVTLEVTGGRSPVDGFLQTRLVGFEAPSQIMGDGGKFRNFLTPQGLQGPAIDRAAFRGLTDDMIRIVRTTYIEFHSGKPIETVACRAHHVDVRLFIGAMVDIKSLRRNTRQMLRRTPDGGFEPRRPENVMIRMKGEEIPAVREYLTLSRGGKIDLFPLGTFRSTCEDVLDL